MGRILRSACALLVLVVTCTALGVAVPAWACGCGAYIPDQDGASVADERALVTWDGQTENIVMALDVSGRSSTAAWVMPVPSTAEVTLGDREVFQDLERLTAPRIEYRDSWWPTFTWLFGGNGDTAGAPGDSAVNVLGQQRLGPFDVTRLAADDPAALATWLADHGFPQPPDLDDNLAPYVDEGWETVAIRLAPAEGESLTGELQPLRLSFASDTMIYPMRLSKSADRPQTVQLYLLADHRMDPRSVPTEADRPYLGYAGRIEAASAGRALRSYVGDNGAFLTRWNNRIGQPEQIESDYVFAQAAQDSPYQRVSSVERNRGDLTGLILLAALGVGAVVVVLAVRRRRRPDRPSTPTAPTAPTTPTAN